MRRPLRNAFLLGIVVGLVVAVIRALRDDQASPAVGTGATPLPRPAPALRPGSSAHPRSSAGTGDRAVEDRPTSEAVPVDDVADVVVAPVTADPLPDPPPGPAADAPTDAAAAAWVPPVEGGCPEGFPVKAKEASHIFHVPEGSFYDRTVPDRCYPSTAAAEADGFRASKR